MSDPGQQLPKPVDEILKEFDDKTRTLQSLCDRTEGLVKKALQHAGVPFQLIQARVKKREKLRTKYETPGKNYRALCDITDLAGIRVITYYEDDIDRAAKALAQEFEIDAERSVDKRATKPDAFGYFGLNLICRHHEKRRNDVEFVEFGSEVFEIQVTSVLRHGWAEIEHDWYDLKDDYPDAIKRRFYRLAALLEIAESEFIDLREKKSAHRKIVAVQISAGTPELRLVSLSLRALVQGDPIARELDRRIKEILTYPHLHELSDTTAQHWLKAAVEAGFTSIQALREGLKAHESDITELAKKASAYWGNRDPDALMERGVCVYYLAILLVGSRGEGALFRMLTTIGLKFRPGDNLTGVSAAAREILRRRP